MRFLLNAQGSLGDVRPMVALARSLKSRGHEALVCAPPDFEPLCAASGLDYRPVGPEIEKIIRNRAPETAGALRGALFLSRTFLKDSLDYYFEKLLPLAKGADMLLGSGIDFAGSSVAQSLDIPYRFTAFTPVAFASSHHPPITLPVFGMPRWANRAAWNITRAGETLLGIRQQYNRRREKLGLVPVGGVADNMAARALLAADPLLSPMPPDVSSDYVQTGYWFTAYEPDLDPTLLDFIKDGPAPVYAGFGSMPPSRKLADAVSELAHGGRRFVVLAKSLPPEARFKHPAVFFLDSAPHSRLFPLMSAAVHHGGSGTTHAAAKAGIPQIVVPYSFDQHYWGHRVRQLELGPAPIKRANLSTETLGAALDQAVSNSRFRQNASAFAPKMRAQGLAEAARLLETLASSKHSSKGESQ